MVKIEIRGFDDKQHPESVCPLLIPALQDDGVILCDEWCAWYVAGDDGDQGCLLVQTGWALVDAAQRYFELNAPAQELTDATAES